MRRMTRLRKGLSMTVMAALAFGCLIVNVVLFGSSLPRSFSDQDQDGSRQQETAGARPIAGPLSDHSNKISRFPRQWQGLSFSKADAEAGIAAGGAIQNEVQDIKEVKSSIKEKASRFLLTTSTRGSSGGRPPNNSDIGDDDTVAFPNRIVHLDFKGGQPRVGYLQQFFTLIRSLGATGVLIEWEDTFPYKCVPETGNLKANRYTMEEVAQIIQSATASGLTVIPLVQTFGHMEHILKLPEFASFRENPFVPTTICARDEKAIDLLFCMLDDVIEALKRNSMMANHDDAASKAISNNLIHLGMDEVRELGLCPKCRETAPQDLYTHHVKRISDYVRAKHGMKSMIWADMLIKDIDVLLDGGDDSAATLRRTEERLKSISQVEPVFWRYTGELPPSWNRRKRWTITSNFFETAWAASAFKGADGPISFVPNVAHRLNNHLSWLNVGHEFGHEFKQGFGGIILTGWSRYTHFSPMCELLPAGVPALALCLEMLQAINSKSGYKSRRHLIKSHFGPLLTGVAEKLSCPSEAFISAKTPSPISSSLAQNHQDQIHEEFAKCNFSGSSVLSAVLAMRRLADDFEKHIFTKLTTGSSIATAIIFNDINLDRGLIHAGLCSEDYRRDFSKFKEVLDSDVRAAEKAFDAIYPSHVLMETLEHRLGKVLKISQTLASVLDLSGDGTNGNAVGPSSRRLPTWPNRPFHADKRVEAFVRSLRSENVNF